MKYKLILTITSLLSIVLFISHWADEVSRGMEPSGLSGIWGIVILVVWLYGTLSLAERRWAYVIVLIGGIFGLGVLILHMTGRGYIGGRITINSPGAFFWTWTLIAIGVISAISIILSTQALWTMRTRRETLRR